MRLFFLFLTTFVLSANSYSQSPADDASDYNDLIVTEQSKLIARILDYNLSSIHSPDPEENNRKRLEILQQINVSIEKLKALAPYKGDSRLRDEALTVLALYKETCDMELNEINELRKNRENSFEAMSLYFKSLDDSEEKLKNAGKQFLKAQKEFAKKHKMTLRDTGNKNHFDEVSNVNRYSRSVTLEYFRVSKTDSYFLDALNQQQSELMDAKRKEILISAELSLSNLNAIQPYNNDKLYKEKAISLIQYHQKLANQEYLELVQILQKKNQLTQQDIDRYNQIVTLVNTDSQKLLAEFNDENKQMLKRNIPAY